LLASARDFKTNFWRSGIRECLSRHAARLSRTLAKETANPLAPKSDEVGKAAEKREKEKPSKLKKKNRRQVQARKNRTKIEKAGHSES